MNTTKYSPSYNYIKYAEKINSQSGHENLGFLSFERGFMPLNNPLDKLPKPFNLWDTIAQNLSKHYENQTLRSTLNKIEILDAHKLDDKHLCRASMLISMLAHAYVRSERVEDLNIPDAIQKPWEIISKRLGRPKPFLSYIDLIIYNWKQKKENQQFTLENLELLIPTVNNREERVFYLTQTEIAFKTIESTKLVVDIQNAIINDNKKKVVKGLVLLKEVMTKITESSFLKINPNPRSKTYVDPVIWAKTVAPFAVPLKEGVQGPSGTSSPFFHLMDTFIERSKYDTILGKEALLIREWYPEHWRNFLNAVEEVSLAAFIKKHNDEELNGAFYSFIESYTGNDGFLGVHRRKVYGYLQMAFKVGRSVTIGGFSGLFKERTWEEVDLELETTRLERYSDKKLKCPFGFVSKSSKSISKNITKVELDISNKGITYRPGDRCSIVPKNELNTVNKIINLLKLTGKETIVLNNEWKNYFEKYYNNTTEQSSVFEILQSAKISNVNKILSLCPHLKLFLKIEEPTKKISFLELIEKLVIYTPNVSQMLLPHFMDFLKPEKERMYSISNEFDNTKIELTISNANTVVKNKVHKGVCSEFLTSETTKNNYEIPLIISRPLRFSLPEDIKEKEITLFAAGSGIAPFRGFWSDLKRKNKLNQLSIYYSVKFINDIVFKDELSSMFFKHGINLNIIATRDHKILDKIESIKQNKLVFSNASNKKIDHIILKNENASKIYSLINPTTKNSEGLFYTCGKAGFALTISNTLKRIIAQYSPAHVNNEDLFYSLFSDNRYMQDVFSSPNFNNTNDKSYYLSDIVNKNNNKNGYWLAINDKVYDVTEFKEIHPGGNKIIVDNSGRDGTYEFNNVNHNKSKEIESLLNMYCIGTLKNVELPNNLKRIYNKWLDALQLCTEMLNTYDADNSFKNQRTTFYSEANQKTPFKIAILVENQYRFLTEYVNNILEIVRTLYKGHESYQSVCNLIYNTVAPIKDVCDINLIQKLAIEDSWEKLNNQEAKNKAFLLSVQKLLWDGLKFFESYETNLDTIHQIAIKNLFDLFKNELQVNNSKEISDNQSIVISI